MSINNKYSQEWFEMKRELRADIMRSAWIPLILSDRDGDGEYGHEDCWRENHFVRTLIVPLDKMDDVFKLEWSNIACDHETYVEDGRFYSVDEYKYWSEEVLGIHPVLVQSLPDEPTEWHLHQDIIFGLGLLKDGDAWFCPVEDYEKVVEIRRNKQGELRGVFIRMEHLRDFLCARNSGLLVATYRDRSKVFTEQPSFGWEDDESGYERDYLSWKGYITPIEEGGRQFGSSTAVFWAGRKTSEPEDEVPTHGGPGDEDMDSSFKEIKHTGRKLYDVLTRLWRKEWIPPANRSPKVRRDEEESTIEFIVDASGARASGEKLKDLRGWLWFDSDIVNELLSRKHGYLKWYTRDTGAIGPTSTYSVHFGVNSNGLINVYAKDIFLLPDSYKRIWQGYNKLPDGPPSQELWMAQMQGLPANTYAPELRFFSALDLLDEVSIKRFGMPVLKHHDFVSSLIRNIHRFRGDGMRGLCSFAKDFDKLITERIDTKLLEHYAPPPEKNSRSIKRLAYFLDSIGREGRQITAPLAGINALRQGDAHLPSSSLSEALELINIADTGDYLEMSQKMIEILASTLSVIADSINEMR